MKLSCFFFAVFFILYRVNGDQFIVLKSPKSLEFKGNSVVSSEIIHSIYESSLGYSTDSSRGPNRWEGLILNDPFNTAIGLVNILIEGLDEIDIKDSKSFKIYEYSDPISLLIENINKHEGVSCDLDLKSIGNQTFESVFGVVVPKYSKGLHFLKAKNNKEVNGFLDQIAMVDGLTYVMEQNDEHIPTAIIIRISLVGLKNLLENDSSIAGEILKVLKKSVGNLAMSADKAYKKKALITVITTDHVLHRRLKRATTATEDELFNIAPAYDKNYPVVFNIIFWFSIIMIFSLLAISLAIGNMDPGRDSIIYRMTSTRMKKDN